MKNPSKALAKRCNFFGTVIVLTLSPCLLTGCISPEASPTMANNVTGPRIFLDAEKTPSAIFSLRTATTQLIINDPQYLTELALPETKYSKLCERHFFDETDAAFLELSDEIIKPTIVGENMKVRLRLPTEEEMAAQNTNLTRLVLEFLSGDSAHPPDPIFGWPCGRETKIYYLSSNRIIVDLGTGFETARAIHLWDGTEWHDVYSLVPAKNPLEVGAVNSENFVIRETKACCDIFEPNAQEGWSNFIFDVESLEIIDVQFRGD